MIKVLVADNPPVEREALKATLRGSDEFNVTASVATTSELFDALGKEKPDVVLLEMDIPEVNGITALRKMKKDYSDVKVLIFSAQAEDVYALSTLRAGASGYVAKTSTIDTLKNAIRNFAEGGMFITNELAQRLAFDESTNKPRRFFRKLSTREVEVLKLLASSKRNKHVAEEVGLQEKTVSTYKARLMRKLN